VSFDGPKPAYFWDDATNSWRKAVVGEAGEYVWNNTTNSWQPGTIGAEYVWNATTNSWDKGSTGGMYKWNASTDEWDKNTTPGGGPFYWDESTKSWVKNEGGAAALTYPAAGRRSISIGRMTLTIRPLQVSSARATTHRPCSTASKFRRRWRISLRT
jgi:hypothetical protein